MSRTYLNNDWQFRFDLNSDEFVPVRIPHTVKETPFNYFSEKEYQTVSEYKCKFYVPIDWYHATVRLTFEGVAHHAEVFINGEKVGEHNCGYTAFTLDITNFVELGCDNDLSVIVDSRESLNLPPFGNVIDYMTYGGIYRDVYLDVTSDKYISDVFATAKMNGELNSTVKIEGEITEGMTLLQRVMSDYAVISTCEVKAERETVISFKVENCSPWSVNSPTLYTLETILCNGNNTMDLHIMNIGFRDAEFKKDGFYLNGEKLKIRGLNRHQAYPYVGYAMPRSMQEMDADVMKYELGLNAVRTSHYPQSQHFINRCDKIGLLVLTEIPGWQYIGDAEWQDQAVKNTEEMIIQYRNHPSIILWGVRINESPDNESLYTRTNEVAHRLDPTRPTGGIRNFRGSQLLEDVYTYNDFVHDGVKPGCEPKSDITPDTDRPYLVTEYGGHMYPTKSFDDEEQKVEHAIRHARVLDAIASYDDISGSFGWCMADYNTHKDFGSGDRICYHGVTDMFRNPKLAAAVYSSQGTAPMLEISSSMDIGDHPACIRGDIWAFTNADSIRTYKDGEFVKEYTGKTDGKFPHLAHSPILIDGFVSKVDDWGGASIAYRFDAVLDGKVVKSVTKIPMTHGSLEIKAYKTTLIEAESYDVTAIRIRAVDEYGNTLYYSSEPIVATTEGPVEILGPSVTSLKGGMGAIYVKTVGKSGKATVTLHTPSLGDLTVNLEVRA